jgi:hypothetical protein
VVLLFALQVNRPLSMKKEGIQTRKRKPKNPGQGSQGPAGPLPGVIKTEVKASIQHGKLKPCRFIRGIHIRTRICLMKCLKISVKNFLAVSIFSEANTYCIQFQVSERICTQL